MTTTKDRATGRDVVLAIGENMRQSLEPLVTKTIAPSLYQVYLHPDDYDYLRTLFGELEAEAKALLDQELERLNRGGSPAVLSRFLRKKDAAPQAPKYVSAEGKWTIRFQEDPNGTLNPGDVEVVSEFARPPEAGYGAGNKTHRISTTRRLGQMTTHRETVPAASSSSGIPSGTAEVATPAALARLLFQDDRGKHTFLMTKDEIVIGRQAPDVWADLSLDTSLDVSREHARLQRTPAGTFRIKDLSKLGTTVDGTPLPRSLEAVDGGVRDLDRWADLPDKARIGLAGVIYLDFERL
ncbi:MAG TPA: FHA domain-containing protein [Thermoanaerobaculia bacterium]|nr:FHA domain-containing protein [Thermoanaerobaculia bacterium]